VRPLQYMSWGQRKG